MFCGSCGTPLEDGARFCAACGTAVDASPVQPGPPPMAQPYVPPFAPPYAPHPGFTPPVPVQSQAKKRGRPSILIILVGLLMVVLSISQQVALVFGQKTTGVVSSVEQILDSSSDRTDYNYRITYRFTSADGKSRTGSYTMNRVYNQASLPRIGSSLLVAYIPVLPQVNSISGRVDAGLATFATLGIGVLLIILGAKSGKMTRA
jgi:hypothetical protein